MEYLDFTRIHPDFYKIAKKIALDAHDDLKLSENEAVIDVMWNSNKLDELDLEDYG